VVVSIEQFLLAAEAVLGIDADRLKQATKIGSAESALEPSNYSIALTHPIRFPYSKGRMAWSPLRRAPRR
jgi:hypothetical protein